MTNQQAPVSSPQATDDSFYPGRDFGLPEFGRGSVAGWSRRLGALLIDWVVCSVIAIAFFYHPQAGHTAAVLTQPRLWTPAVFGVEDCLLTAFTGFTIGKRLVGLRVVRLDGQPVGLPRAFVRTLLLMLVVPAMMMDRDLRGLQDKAAGTIVIRR
ncbi:MAG TPA: RDD family protein [Streptosporangiaceae bacterium]|nr:RDD family protein [Streptosporangiaceae bacterium]